LNTDSQDFDVAIVGTGPAGLATALAVAQTGVNVVVLGPEPSRAGRREDHRTAALFTGSIELLRNLGAWQACAGQSAPLVAIRMLDDRKTLLRAPEVIFRSHEVGLSEFGFNVPNQVLINALWEQVTDKATGLTFIATSAVKKIELLPDRGVLFTDADQSVTSKLIVGADGRNSICRAAAGIETQTWSYPQTAVTCTFQHPRPHHDISTEFHRRSGPLTVVPLPGDASSLVWVVTPEDANSLMGLDDTEFAATLTKILSGLLGDIEQPSKRTAFPLSAMTATKFASNRVALVGESGHVIPPIGAQGLNLGLRDGAVLADCIADALNREEDVGDAQVLQTYDRARQFDVRSRTNAVDIFNRSLLSTFHPSHLARGLGMHVLKSIAPLRRRMMQEGLAPASVTPSLMTPGGHIPVK